MKLKSKKRSNRGIGTLLRAILIGAIFCTPVFSTAMAEVKGSFLYDLSNFTGSIKYNAPRVWIDEERNEISVLYQNTIRVFNENGMEVYRFGDDLDVGHILDMTTDRDGNVLLLTVGTGQPGGAYRYEIVHCNFRGEITGKLTIKNLPASFKDLTPGRMIYRDGKLYFADINRAKIVMTDDNGDFKRGYDLFPLLEIKENRRGDMTIGGFSVRVDGTILFTIPALFSAHVMSPDGKVQSFGQPGGAPGKFNIVTGIAGDRAGHFLVVDKLKCAVMVFDKDYNFMTQFGYRGVKPGNLIAPDDVVVDKSGRVYVTQNGNRGVSVYKVAYN